MKRLFNIMMATILSCVTLFTLGCEEKPTTFGKPEGLFLYSGNTKSLTDGTNAENIIKELTIDGEKTTEFNLLWYKYQGEKAYFVFDAVKSVLAEYDLVNSKTKIIYTENNIENRILSVKSFNKASLLLCLDTDSRKDYINLKDLEISYDGEIIDDTYPNYTNSQVSEKYVVYGDKNHTTFQYKAWGEKEFSTVKAPDGNVNYYLSCGNIYFSKSNTVKAQGEFKRNFFVISYYVFNIPQKKLVTINDLSSGKTVARLGDYYVFGSPKNIAYDDDKLNAILFYNCELYKLKEDFTLTKIYTFKKDYDYTEFNPAPIDKYLYFTRESIEKSSIFKKGGYSYKKEKLNLETLKLSSGKYTPPKQNNTGGSSVPVGIEIGAYIFYTTMTPAGFMNSVSSHHKIMRYNKTTKERECMQYKEANNEFAYQIDAVLTH